MFSEQQLAGMEIYTSILFPLCSNKKKMGNSLLYLHEELEQLDSAGLPEPKSTEELDKICACFTAQLMSSVVSATSFYLSLN